MTPAELDPDDLTLTKEPQQARSRRTLERLRETAWDLLEQDGVEALTVTGVSSGAGVSVGSFYARFEGKEELLDHLEAVALEASIRSWSEAVDAVNAALAGPEGALDGAVDARIEDLLAHLLHLYRRGPARRLLLLSRADGRSAERLNHLHRAVAEALARVTAPQGVGLEAAASFPPLPGSPELLRGAALAAATRELALAVEGSAQGWLFGDSPEARVDRRILHALLTLGREAPSPEPADPPEAASSTAEEAPTSGDSPAEPPDEDPPSPSVELFDVWG